MPVQWSLTIESGCPVFAIAGEPGISDTDRLKSATDWVRSRTNTPVVLDLYYVWGLNAGGESLIGDCVDRLTPPGVVLFIAESPLLQFEDPRLLAAPRIHYISEALAAVTNLARRNARIAGAESSAPQARP